ncbi:MAG TPA: response regulator [Thermomicrobiales bacterium]|nr:response regulator [Thermomicrobiales bacterium]
MVETSGPHGADKTILIVDDSASVRKLIELTLRREGYLLVTASSGVAALAALAENEPDLILLDLMLVQIDGFQLCSIIRNHPRLRHVPIVILTGRESAEDREAGLRAGVNAYVTKPFHPQDLASIVREQLVAPVSAGAS